MHVLAVVGLCHVRVNSFIVIIIFLMALSANSRTCVIRRTYNQFGDRCFAAGGPKLWNSLPVQPIQADVSYEQFKQLLETLLFGARDRSTL